MAKRPTIATREEWLKLLIEELRPLFRQQASVEIPPVHVSVGWPHGKRTIGECWPRSVSPDGANHIFVSPKLAEVGAMVTLIHELCHAVDDAQHAHDAPFIRLASAVGLVRANPGGWKSSEPGMELLATWLHPLVAEGSTFPSYPHSVLTPKPREAKQGTRMLKVVCVDPGCGYTVRTTQKWLDVGLPTCPCGDEMAMPDA